MKSLEQKKMGMYSKTRMLYMFCDVSATRVFLQLKLVTEKNVR